MSMCNSMFDHQVSVYYSKSTSNAKPFKEATIMTNKSCQSNIGHTYSFFIIITMFHISEQ